MPYDCRIIQLQDVDQLLQFEERKLQRLYPDPEERMFVSWVSRARKESLEHYAKLGWSFKALASDTQELQGFILAQPFLFVAGQTQSLWVETLSTNSIQVRDLLTEVIYKLAREKHLQGVYFPNAEGVANSIAAYKPDLWGENPFFVSTVKK